MSSPRRYSNFEDFYANYLREHSDPRNRKYHFVGTGIALLAVLRALCTGEMLIALIAPVAMFGLAWFGHRFREHNHPDSFSQPLYSFGAHLRLFMDVIGQRVYIQ